MKRLMKYWEVPMYRQAGIGAAAGGVTSYLGARAGRLMVLGAGAALLVGLASRRGLIKVNWRQMSELAVTNRYLVAGFAGGVVAGTIIQ